MKPSHKRWLLAPVVIALVVVLTIYGKPIVAMLGDVSLLREWLRGLGPWGPVALIAVNAAQIVVAPVPGMLVQGVAGYLFGVWPGALYGGLGMALGGTISMTLGRAYGRPIVNRLVGEQRLHRWEGVLHSDSPVIWVLLMLPPFGDIPYLIAGLSKVSIWRVLAIMLVVRFPSAILHAAIGAGVEGMSRWWLVTLLAALAVVGLVALLYGKQIRDWFEDITLSRLTGEQSSEAERSEEDKPG